MEGHRWAPGDTGPVVKFMLYARTDYVGINYSVVLLTRIADQTVLV
jgi:hypothetical protein